MPQDYITSNSLLAQGSVSLEQRLFQTERLISALGTECVRRLILGEDAETDSPVEQQPSLASALLPEVAALGVELNRRIVALVVNSDVEVVKASINIYATYDKVENPNGLFYTILTNQNRGNQRL